MKNSPKKFSVNHNYPEKEYQIYTTFIYVDLPDELKEFYRDKTMKFLRSKFLTWDFPELVVDYGHYKSKPANKPPVFIYGIDMTDSNTFYRVRIGAYNKEDLKRIRVYIKKITEVIDVDKRHYYRVHFGFDIKRKSKLMKGD